MQTPLRIMRAHLDNQANNRPPLSEKQREREERIIAQAQKLMGSYSGDTITIAKLARAMRMAPATIQQHFIDIESILAEILLRHLIQISRAIGKIPHNDPNRQALQRAAYIETTRTPWGGLTDPHELLLRARHTLPEDLAKPIEDLRQLIGETLGGDHAATALTLLDAPHLQAPDIEALLATATGAAKPTASAPTPARPQAQPPAPRKSHYKDWKAAKRQKAQMAREARAGPPNSSA